MSAVSTASGRAGAKAILAGEHFVLYGCPAIAAPVPGLDLTVDLTIVREAVAHEGHVAECLLLMRERFGGPPPESVCAAIRSTIPIGAGLGSSAALSVAVARAWAALVGFDASAEDIRAASLACERIAHGNPSGVDTEVALSGRAVRFVRGAAPSPIRITAGIGLVAIDTGVVSPTAEQVAEVARRREADGAAFGAALDRAAGAAAAVERALAAGAAAALGRAFADAHVALEAIGIVNDAVRGAVDAALTAGAAGAKVTGAGGGGVVIAATDAARIGDLVERLGAAGARVVAAGPLRAVADPIDGEGRRGR